MTITRYNIGDCGMALTWCARPADPGGGGTPGTMVGTDVGTFSRCGAGGGSGEGATTDTASPVKSSSRTDTTGPRISPCMWIGLIAMPAARQQPVTPVENGPQLLFTTGHSSGMWSQLLVIAGHSGGKWSNLLVTSGHSSGEVVTASGNTTIY